MNSKINVFGLLTVGALIFSGCGSNANESSSTISVNGSEPQTLLIPSSVNEVGGGRIVEALFSRLVKYTPEGEAIFDVAESITTSDSITYNVVINKGEHFSNGEEVTSKSFVDAWNYASDPDNKQLSADFFSPIKGYEDLSSGTGSTKKLSGLSIIDDYNFSVVLSEPTSDFITRLGYSAFSPLPEVAFENMDNFGKKPIGNGPYMLDSWNHNVSATLVSNPEYTGKEKPKNSSILFKFYQNLEAAYRDLLANNLDVLDSIPPGSLTSYKGDLGDKVFEKETARIDTVSIPTYIDEWAGDIGKLRRQAISMAINRDEIAETIYRGTRSSAKEFSAPVVNGWKDNLPGNSVLEYNPEQAKLLWEEANAIEPWKESQIFTLAYNTDGGHKATYDAIANSIKNVLGIQAEGKPYPTFSALRTEATRKSLTGALRSGWQADYPSMSNFLLPVYVTGAGSNDASYNNPTFDALMLQGNAAPSVQEGIDIYLKAQEILLEDLPAIPLWYVNSVGGHSDNVKGVRFMWNGAVDYENLELAK